MSADYATVLSYFVLRNRPTYGFVDLAPNMAVVAIEYFVRKYYTIPMAYVFLDSSIVAQYWYYLFRYVFGGYASPDSLMGPAQGSAGPLVLISGTLAAPPNMGMMDAAIPGASQGATPQGWSPALGEFSHDTNPMLVQVSLGTAPLFYGDDPSVAPQPRVKY